MNVWVAGLHTPADGSCAGQPQRDGPHLGAMLLADVLYFASWARCQRILLGKSTGIIFNNAKSPLGSFLHVTVDTNVLLLGLGTDYYDQNTPPPAGESTMSRFFFFFSATPSRRPFYSIRKCLPAWLRFVGLRPGLEPAEARILHFLRPGQRFFTLFASLSPPSPAASRFAAAHPSTCDGVQEYRSRSRGCALYLHEDGSPRADVFRRPRKSSKRVHLATKCATDSHLRRYHATLHQARSAIRGISVAMSQADRPLTYDPNYRNLHLLLHLPCRL